MQNVNPVIVSTSVFSLVHSADGGFFLDRVYDIGSFTVYLGANQALVLPAVQESAMQRANTIYIQHDDGVFQTAVVVCPYCFRGGICSTIPTWCTYR